MHERQIITVIKIDVGIFTGYASHQSCAFASWPGVSIHEVSYSAVSDGT
jgi:hypothetical protein